MDKMVNPWYCCYLLLVLLVSRVFLTTSTRILAGSETERLHGFSAEDDSLPFLLGGIALQQELRQDKTLFTDTTPKELRSNIAVAMQAPIYYPAVYGHESSASPPSPSYLQSYSPSSPSPSYSSSLAPQPPSQSPSPSVPQPPSPSLLPPSEAPSPSPSLSLLSPSVPPSPSLSLLSPSMPPSPLSSPSLSPSEPPSPSLSLLSPSAPPSPSLSLLSPSVPPSPSSSPSLSPSAPQPPSPSLLPPSAPPSPPLSLLSPSVPPSPSSSPSLSPSAPPSPSLSLLLPSAPPSPLSSLLSPSVPPSPSPSPSSSLSPSAPSPLPSPLAPLPSIPLPPTPNEDMSLPSKVPSKDEMASLPPSTFIPVSGVSPPLPPSGAQDQGPPYCAAILPTCLTVNATVGTTLDAFLLSVAGWKSSSSIFVSLVYEFGVLAISAVSGITVRRPRQVYSEATVATLAGLPVGNTSLYVCVRSATRSITGMDAIGPRTCATVVIQISAQVSSAQVASVLSAIEDVLSSLSSNASTSSVLSTVQRLAAVAAFANGAFAASTRSLASELLQRLVTSSVSDTSNTSSVLIMAFDGLSTLWSMADAHSRTSVLTGINALSAKLASQPLAAEDVQLVADFFDSMIVGAVDVITSLSLSLELGAQTANDMLMSVMHGADSISRGLLNSAVCNGSTVQFATSRLSAAAQCVTTVLATASGPTVSLARPWSPTVRRRRNRVLLASGASLTFLPAANVTLHPAIGSLCSADNVCASMGLRFTVTIMTENSLLIMALGGSAISLASNLSDYRMGGSVEIVSPIVRFAAPGLPFTTSYLSNVVTFDIPVNMTAIMARGSTSTRLAVVRLQDTGAAPADPSLGISPGPSTTGTTQSNAFRGIVDAISGYSNTLGDFMVLQYESSIAIQNSASASPSPDDASTGGSGSTAGQGMRPFLLLTVASVICVMLSVKAVA